MTHTLTAEDAPVILCLSIYDAKRPAGMTTITGNRQTRVSVRGVPMPESDLYHPLKTSMESLGFFVKGEVDECDVPALR